MRFHPGVFAAALPPGSNPVENYTYRGGPLSGALINSSNLATSSTFFLNDCLPVESTLTRVEIQANATASVKLKLATPLASGGWTVTNLQTLSVTAGLNTFTVSGGTLTTQSIPAKSFIGVFCSTTGALQFINESAPLHYEGYTAFTGDVSGAVTAVSSAQIWQHQLQFAWEASVWRTGLPTYIFNETFDGTVPARHLNSTTPWTFSSGATVPGGTSQFLRQWFTTNADRKTLEADFQFTDSSTTFVLFTIPVIGGGSTDNGACIGVSISANTLIWYNPMTSTIPTVRGTDTITDFTLSTGVNYRLKLNKSGKTMTATIVNLDTSVEFSKSYDNDVSYLVGLDYGAAGMAVTGSTGVSVTAWRYYLDKINPRIGVYGDSITEGSGTTDDLGFAQLLLDEANDNGIYSGDGGTSTVSIFRRWMFDNCIIIPKYVIVLSGANNAVSDAERDKFEPDMSMFIDRVIAAGSIPIICYITPNSDAASQTRINVMNGQLTTILSTRPTAIGVRTDVAISVGGDGVTWDTTKMLDGVHPNATGHAALAAAIIAAAPQAFA